MVVIQVEGKRTVVAISGPSGARKTTIVVESGRVLADATLLFFDYYGSVAKVYPNQTEWVREGCDPDARISVPQLVTDLQKLRKGDSIERPPGDRFPSNVPRQPVVHSARYIFLEEPWGRDRTEISSLIDLVVHIDVPLDVSLCRRMIRDALFETPLDRARDYLESSLHGFYARQQKVGDRADLVVDGRRSVEEIVGVAADFIQNTTAEGSP